MIYVDTPCVLIILFLYQHLDGVFIDSLLNKLMRVVLVRLLLATDLGLIKGMVFHASRLLNVRNIHLFKRSLLYHFCSLVLECLNWYVLINEGKCYTLCI